MQAEDYLNGAEPRLYDDKPKRANSNRELAGLANQAALVIV